MAHGLNARRNNGKEWWGKRPLSNTGVPAKKGMKFYKRLLHKKERSIKKSELNKLKANLGADGECGEVFYIDVNGIHKE